MILAIVYLVIAVILRYLYRRQIADKNRTIARALALARADTDEIKRLNDKLAVLEQDHAALHINLAKDAVELAHYRNSDTRRVGLFTPGR